MEITIQQAVAAHQEGKLEEAERLYLSLLKIDPKHLDAHNNLGVLFSSLGRFDEAETSYRKAIEYKPDFAEAHNNLGTTLKDLTRFDEAETSFNKAKELKPDYAEAYSNLGKTLYTMGRLKEAETSYKKAIELAPSLTEAKTDLGLVLMYSNLISKVLQKKNSDNKIKISFVKKLCAKLFNSNLRLPSYPLILKRNVEAELISYLYKMNTKKLDEVDPDTAYLRYGNGRSSDYKLFENNSPIIKNVTKDLIDIIEKTVKSEVHVVDSFFNIFQTESGIAKHAHITDFDRVNGLVDQKFSLTYYLSVGDQDCTEPGYLKLYNPDKKILPTEGMIAIFPASRKHSAVYNGKTDRVMIGVNFYSLL